MKCKLKELSPKLPKSKPKNSLTWMPFHPSRASTSNDTSKPPAVSTNGYVEDDEDTIEFIPKPDKKARPSLEEMQKEREKNDAEMLNEIKKNSS